MAGQEHSNNNEDKTISANNHEGLEPTNESQNIVEEYELLDSQLDEINSALDFLEQKNDDIHAKLRELLQSNIDIREQLKQENSSGQ